MRLLSQTGLGASPEAPPGVAREARYRHRLQSLQQEVTGHPPATEDALKTFES